MKHYQNFSLAIYCPAPTLKNIKNKQDLAQKFAFFEKHLKVNKVYLETHRGSTTIPEKKMLEIKNFFTEKAIETAGGITPTYRNKEKNLPPRLLDVYCYTDPDLRKHISKISEYTASLFDEFILDDFFFTNCTCDSCIEEKGEKTWEKYRLELMADVSRDLIVKPAQKINSDVKVIIKYPNWVESFQQTGYNTETQPEIFDYVYTGTETRDSHYTQQHLPRYGSYSLMRLMENIKPGANMGGWFDSIDCIHNIGYYLEQANLTVFSRARELMLFSFGGLQDSVFVPPLGHQLEKLDQTAELLDKPEGIAVYIPHHSRGEDHLYDYLAMTGIPFEPVAHFPETDNTILITASAARDKKIMEKLKKHLKKGYRAVITSGFVKLMENKGIADITSARITDKKATTDIYAIETSGCAFSNYISGQKPVSIPVLTYQNNDSWPEIVTINGENNFPLLLKDYYGGGTLYTLTIPDNFADLYHLPAQVLTEIRKTFMSDLNIHLEGEAKIGLFLYQNNTVLIESFRPYRSTVRLQLKDQQASLKEADTGREIRPIQQKNETNVFAIRLEPSTYKVLKIEN